jgi:hypothetical protein
MADEKPRISERKPVRVEEHIMGKMKFNVGDKIIGNNKKADYWDKKGVVIGYNQATGEYQIRLENGEVHYVSPRWFDKFD